MELPTTVLHNVTSVYKHLPDTREFITRTHCRLVK